MDHSEKASKPSIEETSAETVRGSGFTYDEDKKHTDHSVPLDKVKESEIVELPDLGKPDRP